MSTDKKTPIPKFLIDLKSRIKADITAYQNALRSFAEMQERIEESRNFFVESQKHIAQQVKAAVDVSKMIKMGADHASQIQLKLTKDLSSFVSQAVEFQRNLNSIIRHTNEETGRWFKTMPETTRNALVALGNHGWYLDLGMGISEPWELGKALTDGNIDEAEAALTEHFKERIPEIEEALIKNFPHRAKILSSAFRAHSRGEYDLSIPVLLAQADGICQELIGFKLYSKRKKVPATAKYIESCTVNPFKEAILYPFSISLPVSYSEYERDEKFLGLNRHQVLHGESLEYGTEVNSLKAVSLLNYVAQVLKK